MQIEMAHVQEQGINCAIFSADARDRSQAGRRALLGQLVAKARQNRLRIDKTALAFEEAGASRSSVRRTSSSSFRRAACRGPRTRWTSELKIEEEGHGGRPRYLHYEARSVQCP
jgi:hypothetical protein